MANRSESDPFVLLGLPHQFDLDRNALEQAFRQKQKEVHPDRASDAADRRARVQRSADINDAFRRLQTWLGRGEALFEHFAGIPVSGEATANDPELLMWAMERREALSELHSDASGLPDFELQMNSEQDAVCSELSRIFSSLDTSPSVAKDRDEIQKHLTKLRYLARMASQLKELKLELPDKNHPEKT